MAIDPFKRALIINAIKYNQEGDGSILISGLTPEAAEDLQKRLNAEPYVGIHIERFSWTVHQGLTMLGIHLKEAGRFHILPWFNLLLGQCLGMYLEVESFNKIFKDYVNRLIHMIPKQ